MPKRLPDGSVVFIPQGEQSPFYYNETVRKYRREYTEFGFEYARSFKSHNIGGMVNYNQNKLYDPELAFLVPRGYQGLVGRVTYDFDQRYLAEFNIGYNGTENFAEGKRFGLFPAYSLGWLVSEESFFPKNNYVSMLKIRGSSGEVGNDQVGGDRFLYLPSSYGYTANYYNFGTFGVDLNGYQGSSEGKIGNPNLTWERARKTNIGVEMGLWKDHIKITADWFNETRDNILASLGTVPTIVGATLPAQNLGKMKNSGFDGDITYNNAINQFNYWVKANFTYAHNVVQFRDEASKMYVYQNQTGQRFGQNFGLIAEGFYNTWEEVNAPSRPISQWNSNKIQPGDVKYRDVNGDGYVNSDDAVPIGYSNFPEKTYGISMGGTYKGLDFSLLFQGADNVSVSYSRHARYGFREDAGVPDYILERSWTQERYEQGLPIDFPHLSEGDTNQKHNYTASSLWVRDASYVRLKNAELGYTLSGVIAKKLGITSVRFFANGNNLITWSNMLPGIDPESNVADTNWEPYPLTQTMNFGLNVRF
jgi:TonB-linked SusC/RagA family outer membrane protein